jgi:DNA polymerase III epsilon subunit-like protein
VKKMSELLIVIDTETTGLPKDMKSDVRPVSFGAVAYYGPEMEEVDHLYFLIRPDVFAEGYLRAEAIHGITEDRLHRDGLPMNLAWERMVSWVQRVITNQNCGAGECYFMAWNSKFDRLVMSLWAKGQGMPMDDRPLMWPDWSDGDLEAPQGCLQHLYREWTKTQPGIKTPRYGALNSAAQTLGVGKQAAIHNALADARMAGAILAALRARA